MAHMPSTSGPTALDLTRGIVSVKDYGAVGDGVADDTDAINDAVTAAIAAAGSGVDGGAVYFPAGSYRVTETLTLPSYVTLMGESRYTTTLRWSGADAVDARMFEFEDKYGCGFQDMQIRIDEIVDSPNFVTLFYLSNCFRFTWHRMIIQGNHTTSTPDPQSTGIEFRENAGDNRIIDCDINALGAGIRTSAIMNYAIGCVFGTCRYGIYGDTGTLGAGFIVEGCTFVGTGVSGTTGTQAHIICDRGGNVWRVVGCWLEGSRVGIEIGAAAGGPQEFGVIGCKIAAVDTGINLRSCALATLVNVTFSADNTGTPSGSHEDIIINATDAPNGTAIGMRSSDAFDFSGSDFPSGWVVAQRGAARLPPTTITGAVSVSGAASLTSTLAVTSTSTLTGDVGMGAAPSSGNKLHVQGNGVSTSGWYTNASRTVGMNESSGTLQFRTGNADARLTIDGSGQATMAGNLAVNGNTRLGNAAGDTIGFYTTAGSAQQALVALTDNSGGTANDTIQALADGVTYANDVAALRNNLADLAAKINAIRTILLNLGVIA